MSSTFSPRPTRSPKRAVPAQARKAGHGQIAQPAQARKSFRAGAAGHPQPPDFRHGPGDQRRLGVVAEAKSVPHPGRDRHHVLQRAPQFHSQHVAARINPESRTMKKKLNSFGDLRVRMRRHNRSGNSLRHLQRKTRPRQRPRRRLRHGRAQNAGHRQPRLIFNPLGHAHGNSPEPGRRAVTSRKNFEGTATTSALASRRRRQQVRLAAQLRRQPDAGQKNLVAPRALHLRAGGPDHVPTA